MAADNFFTTFKNYFKLCSCRGGCCFAKDGGNGNGNGADRNGEGSGGTNSNMSAGDSSPYSFDDLSNPLSPTMTNSSSGSSIDSFYKDSKLKPYIGIIPANYYRN